MASTNSTSSFTAVNEGEFANFADLTGKIIIKAEYGDVIRKVPIHNEEITYDELLIMMVRLFKLSPTDEIELKYRDEDGDLVSIVDGNDIAFAIQCSRLLKLKVLVNAKTPSVSVTERKVIRDELIGIRNRCIELLDKLDHSLPMVATATDDAGTVVDQQQQQKLTESTQAMKISADEAKKQYQGPPPKEFDPLSNSSSNNSKPPRTGSPAVATLQAQPIGKSESTGLDSAEPKPLSSDGRSSAASSVVTSPLAAAISPVSSEHSGKAFS